MMIYLPMYSIMRKNSLIIFFVFSTIFEIHDMQLFSSLLMFDFISNIVSFSWQPYYEYYAWDINLSHFQAIIFLSKINIYNFCKLSLRTGQQLVVVIRKPKTMNFVINKLNE